MNDDPAALERKARFEEILVAHDELLADGITTPQLDEYVRLHPDLAGDLRAYFAEERQFRQRAGPLCALAGTGDGEPLPIRSFGKYEVLCKEGGGGMGVVVRAFDCVVKREVVLKVMKQGALTSPELVRRFQFEGRILGQLEYPSIVPLHEMGETAAHEPYLAMKLVRGHTLDRLLKRRASLEERREWFLDIFVKVCQAVHYAHGKRVLHRDLKPGNVMVGEHEETQLTDFGLARILGPAAAAAPAGARPAPALSPAADQTRVGVILGTLAYMAPEQARGEVDSLDERCDVFGLGGILCEILTGHPPRASADVVLLAQDTYDPQGASLAGAHERLSRCGGPTPLVLLCKKCLVYSPAGRPPSARAVAEGVLAYRAGLEKVARDKELEAAAANERARQAVKKRRLAYALLAAMLLLTGVGVLLWRSAAEMARVEAETETSVYRLVRESRERRDAGRDAMLDRVEEFFKDAVKAARQADEQARRGPATEAVLRTAREALEEAEADLGALGKDRRLMARLLELLILPEHGDPRGKPGVGQMLPAAPEQEFAAAFREWGADPDGTPALETAARIRSRPQAVATELIAALDLWASFRREQKLDSRRRLLDLAGAADQPEPRRQELRKLLASPELNRQRIRELAREVKPASEPTLTLVLLTRALEEVGEREMARRLLRAAVRARPADAILHARLGVSWFMRGVGLASAQLFAGQPVPLFPPDGKLPATPVGDKTQDFQEAVTSLEALRALRPESRLLLAVALLKTPRAEEGLEMLREMRQQRKGDPMLELTFAQAMLMKGKAAEAAEAAQKVVQAGGDSDVGQMGRLQQASLAVDAKDWEKAEALFREVLRSAKVSGIRLTAYLGHAAALQKLGRTAEAIQAFGEASRISQHIPSGHVFLAQKLEQVKDLKGAESILGRGVKGEDPDNAALLVYVIRFLQRQGREREKDVRVIRQMLSKARLPEENPCLFKLGWDAIQIQEHPVAVRAFRKLLQSEPNHLEAQGYLASCLNRTGRAEEAESIALKLIQARPDSGWGHFVQGTVFYDQKQYAKAEGPLRKAVELNPEYADACLMLGDTLRRLLKPAEAEAFLRRGLKLAPRYFAAYPWLSEVLRAQGRPAEAEKVLREAKELQGKQGS